MARAAVYIDGFNLYYGALKGTQYKWLDVEALARRLAPTDQLVAVRYFTARVRPQPNDHSSHSASRPISERSTHYRSSPFTLGTI
jgi:hypothetical protein